MQADTTAADNSVNDIDRELYKTLPILFDNPYRGHPELKSPLEAEVLWEYAKMVGLTRELTNATRNLSVDPSNDLLAKLRVVEQQMGLVLTLFKASVWSTIVTAEAENPEPQQTFPPVQPRARPSTAFRRAPEEDSYYTDEGDTITQGR